MTRTPSGSGHLLPWQSSYRFNENMLKWFLKKSFYSISICLVWFMASGIWGKNYIQELVSAHYAILWGLLEFSSWKCLAHTLLHRKSSTIFSSALCSMNYINLLVGYPKLEYCYLMTANAKKFILPGKAIYSYKMKLCSLIQVYLMDMNRCVFLGFFLI